MNDGGFSSAGFPERPGDQPSASRPALLRRCGELPLSPASDWRPPEYEWRPGERRRADCERLNMPAQPRGKV